MNNVELVVPDFHYLESGEFYKVDAYYKQVFHVYKESLGLDFYLYSPQLYYFVKEAEPGVKEFYFTVKEENGWKYPSTKREWILSWK